MRALHGASGHIRARGLFATVFTVVCLVTLALPPHGAAQTTASETNSIRKFVDDVGQTLYFLAWPTATYKKANLAGIERLSNGFDVKVKLHGTSAFDNGDLWTELIVELRDGRIADIRWGENNAILFKPGESIKIWAQALADLNAQYASRIPATPSPNRAVTPPPPVPRLEPIATAFAVVCLNNPTTVPITYALSYGGQTQSRTLQPGQGWLAWADVASPRFTLAFDNSLDDGYTGRTLILLGVKRQGKPTTCDDDLAYDFQNVERAIGIKPRRWLPGFEHTFTSTLVRGQTENDWHCAAGFKWVSSDTKDLSCIAKDIGLIGVTLARDEGVPFPRIDTVTPGSAAAKAGLPSGAYLISVNGASVEARPNSEVIAMVRGTVGSSVRIVVAGTAAAPRVFELVRQ